MNDYDVDEIIITGTLIICLFLAIIGGVSQREEINKLEKKNNKLKTELKEMTKERDTLNQKATDYKWQLEQVPYLFESRCENGH